jgi:hypothetical protein
MRSWARIVPLPASKKTRALLAYLCATGRAHRREALASCCGTGRTIRARRCAGASPRSARCWTADAESVREAYRSAAVHYNQVWSATLFENGEFPDPG